MKNNCSARRGLILLVVLGMLSLFSLLALSYMVVSSQSRASSFGMARQDYRGTPPSKLLDAAMRQALRGTSDTDSIWWRNSLLGDLYGNAYQNPTDSSQYRQSDAALLLAARSNLRDNPNRSLNNNDWLLPVLPFAANSLEAPRLVSGSFLRIPLQWNANLPRAHDAWNARVLTFLDGPLRGISFNVVRYLGEMDAVSDLPQVNGQPVARDQAQLTAEQSSQYSITIDLATVTEKLVTVGGVTRTLGELLANPQPNDVFGLCYDGNVGSPYSLWLNSAVQSSYGHGFEALPPGAMLTEQSLNDARAIAALSHLASSGNDQFPQSYRSYAMALLANFSQAHRANPGFVPAGDADESYDAADFNDFALSFRHRQNVSGGPPQSADIIPALHRPSVINYIYEQIKTANPPTDSTFQPIDLVSTIELLQRASGRPLSWRIRNFPLAPAGTLQQHAGFTGGNSGSFNSGIVHSPQLDIDWSQWGNQGHTEQAKLDDWVRWLTLGPWDVDNDADGVSDSVWTDINLPLMTSREGKLLKALASYYIEDLGGRLDVNASGSLAQAQAAHSNFSAASGSEYAFSDPNDGSLPQGLGYGVADISLRHLFASDADYISFLRSRNAPSNLFDGTLAAHGPGVDTDDLVSMWRQRHRPARHVPLGLSGLPMSVFGRSGLAVDLFGNPIIFEHSVVANHLDQNLNDPYEMRLMSGAHSDNPFSIAEWERLYRFSDHGRSSLPRRLDDMLFRSRPRLPGDVSIIGRALSPRSIAITAPRFGGSYMEDLPTASGHVRLQRRAVSFMHIVESLEQQRRMQPNPPNPPPQPAALGNYPLFSTDVLAELFPIEFQQNLPLDLNRPLGNGADDNNNGMIDDSLELSGHGVDDDGYGQNDFGPSAIDDPGEVDDPQEITSGIQPMRHQRAEAANGTPYNTILEQYTFTGRTPPPTQTDQSAFYTNPESQSGLFDPYFTTEFQSLPTSQRESIIQAHNGDQSRQLLARHLYCLAQLILPDDYIFPNQQTTTPFRYGSAERARILAQWAINVVDFRDSDYSMTRFPYDPEPFGRIPPPLGDGIPGWNPTVDAQGNPMVVWGYEQPDLLLTESMAFHDLRISMDAEQVPPTSQRREFNPEKWHQIRIPEGSLFLELFCPRSAGENTQGIPARDRVDSDRYWTDNGQLNVSAVSPPDADGERYPVWRVLLLEPPAPGQPSVFDAYKNDQTRFSHQYQFAPDAGLVWDTSGTTVAPVVSRVVWFTGLPSTPANIAPLTDARLFKYNVNTANNPLLLNRGQYLVAGPRDITFIGQRQPRPPQGHSNPPMPPDSLPDKDKSYPAIYNPSEQSIELLGNAVRMNGFGGTEFTSVNTRTVVLQSERAPNGWTTQRNVGLNISEPTLEDYYTEPTQNINAAGPSPFPITDGYVNRATDAFANSTVDPEDRQIGPLVAWEVEEINGNPARHKFRSRMNWSTAVLQRLANPDRPFHEKLNPYVSIDWLPIDLTVFSGEVNDFEPIAGNRHRIKSIDRPDAAENDDLNTPENEEVVTDLYFRFNSRQKTGLSVRAQELVNLGQAQPQPSIEMRAGRTFYSYHTENSFRNDPIKADAQTNFEFSWLINPTINAPRLNGQQHLGQWITLGDLNSRYGLRGVDGGNVGPNQYNRAPVFLDANGNASAPLAPFWPNRDFVSALEIANVPLSSPGQLMQDFSATRPANPATERAFQHLLDFEMATSQASPPPPPPTTAFPNKSAAAILEVIGTRSPWVDSEKMLDPNVVFDPTPSNLNDQLTNVVFSIYRAPYNRVPTHKEPGKVNLNTTAESDVFRGLMWGAMTPRVSKNDRTTPVLFQDRLELNRSAGPPTMRLDPAVPSQFPNVYRSAFSAGLGPTNELKKANAADVGLLRNDATAPGTRVLAAGSAVPFNPLLQNLPASRLQNLTSGNSHVYAMRVTIGFFEYDPLTGGLGQEYGQDDGTAMRHQGFYVIDRSIPVGYQEGQDLNTEKCILVRRIIE